MCGALIEYLTGTIRHGVSAIDWKTTHIKYHENMVSREEARTMSSVRWCDNGNHPFKAGIPGAQTMVGAEIDENGRPVAVEVDICPDHTQKGREKALRELEATQKENDYGAPTA